MGAGTLTVKLRCDITERVKMGFHYLSGFNHGFRLMGEIVGRKPDAPTRLLDHARGWLAGLALGLLAGWLIFG